MCLFILYTDLFGVLQLSTINGNVGTMYEWMLIPITNIEDANVAKAAENLVYLAERLCVMDRLKEAIW